MSLLNECHFAIQLASLGSMCSGVFIRASSLLLRFAPVLSYPTICSFRMRRKALDTKGKQDAAIALIFHRRARHRAGTLSPRLLLRAIVLTFLILVASATSPF